MPTETTSAPAPLSTARRENVEGFSILVMCLPQPIISAARLTAEDADVGAAAALEAFERVLDLGLGRLLLVASSAAAVMIQPLMQ